MMDHCVKGIAFAVVLIGLTICQECFNFKKLATVPVSECQLMEQNTGIRSVLECTKMCTFAAPCAFVQYCRNEHTCALYETCAACTAIFANSSDGNLPITVSRIQPVTPPPISCVVNKYLVTGPDGVADNQLSESSYYCSDKPTFCPSTLDGFRAKYGRLNTTGEFSAYAPRTASTTDYAQVDFLTTMLTTGIVLNGRGPPNAHIYTTAVKVLYSLDCVTFTNIQDGSGNDQIFAGSSFPEELVTRMFDQPIPARCIRINPITWVDYPCFRFDVLGC